MTYSEPVSVISIIVSLVITMVAYCFFPLLYAYCENEPISKTKYRLICFGFNFIIAVLFQFFSSNNSGMPYWLWTFIFSSVGIRMLDKKGLIANSKQSFQGDSEDSAISDKGTPGKGQTDAPKDDSTQVQKNTDKQITEPFSHEETVESMSETASSQAKTSSEMVPTASMQVPPKDEKSPPHVFTPHFYEPNSNVTEEKEFTATHKKKESFQSLFTMVLVYNVYHCICIYIY